MSSSENLPDNHTSPLPADNTPPEPADFIDSGDANADFWTEYAAARRVRQKEHEASEGYTYADGDADEPAGRFRLPFLGRRHAHHAPPPSAEDAQIVPLETGRDEESERVHAEMWAQWMATRQVDSGDALPTAGRALPTPATEEPVIQGANEHEGFWAEVSERRKEDVDVKRGEAQKYLFVTRRRSRFIAVATLASGLLIGAFAARWHYTAEKTVLTINGTNITQPDYLHRLEVASGKTAVDQMINSELQLQFAKSKGVVPTAAQIEARLAEMQKQPGFHENMVANRMSIDDAKNTVRVKLAQNALLTEGVQATDDEIRAFYNANIDKRNLKAAFYTPETSDVSLILTNTKAAGEKALRELQSGISFATVAKTYSVDQSNDQAGVVPTIPRGRTMLSRIPGLEDAIFGLNAGQQFGPLQFGRVWWIVRCTNRHPAVTQPFESVKTICRDSVLLSKGVLRNGDRLQKEFGEFHKKARIVLFSAQ